MKYTDRSVYSRSQG